MLPNGEGRYCLHCQKSVIDFTGKSDAEVARIIQAAPGEVCGRVLRSQLGRPLYAIPPRTTGWRLAASFALFALALPHALLAQQPSSNTPTVSMVATTPSDSVGKSVTRSGSSGPQSQIVAHVFEAETGEAVVGAKVWVQNMPVGAFSDESGMAEFVVDPASFTDSIRIMVAYIGTEYGPMLFSKEELPLEINLGISTDAGITATPLNMTVGAIATVRVSDLEETQYTIFRPKGERNRTGASSRKPKQP